MEAESASASSLGHFFRQWKEKGADTPLTFVDYFPLDVVDTHSAVYRLLLEDEPSLKIHWIHGHTLARRLVGGLLDNSAMAAQVELGIFTATSDPAGEALDILLSGQKAAFIVSFYQSSLSEINRSSKILAKVLADFLDRAVACGHIVICCASRPILSIDALNELLIEHTFAVLATGYYDHQDPLPAEVARALPTALHPIFRTRSKALKSFMVDSVARAENLTRLGLPVECPNLSELAMELSAAGFYEPGFRLQQWCAAETTEAVIPLELDIYRDASQANRRIVGLLDESVRIPEIRQYSCLSGSAGSGKTTIMLDLVRQWTIPGGVKTARPTPSWIPVLVTIGTDDISTVLTPTLRTEPLKSGSMQPSRFARDVELTLLNMRWLFCSPVLLMIDDFDKVTPSRRQVFEEQIEKFRSLSPDGGILIACRKGHEPSLPGFVKFVVRPLSNAQADAILKAQKSQLDFDRLAGSHQKTFAQFARNPFLLTMLARSFRHEEEIDALTLYSLVDRYVKSLLTSFGRDQHQDEFVALVVDHWLPRLGLEMRQGAPASTLEVPEEAIDFGSRVGILRQVCGNAGLTFCHSLIQDYFAAKRLVRSDGNTICAHLPSDRTLLQHWRNALRMLFAVLEPRALAILLDHLAFAYPDLAAEALSDRSDLWNSAAAERMIGSLCSKTQEFNTSSADARLTAARALGWMDARICSPPDVTKGFVLVDGKGTKSGFWAERFPVTNMQYAEFIRKNGYYRREFWADEGWNWRCASHAEYPLHWQELEYNAANLPVVGVSLCEALAYCNWLNSQSSSGRWHFAIPTQAQWIQMAFSPDTRQFTAARRLITDSYPAAMETKSTEQLEEIERSVTEIAGLFERDLDVYREQLMTSELAPVGIYPPNTLGLHDMFCHVWQWCDSWATTRSTRPSTQRGIGEPVVVMGGPGENRNAVSLLLGGWFDASTRFDRIGFRICATRQGRFQWKFRRQR